MIACTSVRSSAHAVDRDPGDPPSVRRRRFSIDHRVALLSGNTDNVPQFTTPLTSSISQLVDGPRARPTRFTFPCPHICGFGHCRDHTGGGAAGLGYRSVPAMRRFDPVTDKVTPLAPAPAGRGTGPLSIAWTGQSVLFGGWRLGETLAWSYWKNSGLCTAYFSGGG